MARLSASARRQHEREIAVAFGGLLQRQAKRVAEQLRVRAQLQRALVAGPGGAGEADDWWEEQAETEAARLALRAPIVAAALASARAVTLAYDSHYHPDRAFDVAMDRVVAKAVERTNGTTRSTFERLVAGLDFEDAAAAIDRYIDGPLTASAADARSDTVGVMETTHAAAEGGAAALEQLTADPDDNREPVKTWLLSSDHETTDDCDDNDGLSIPVSEDWPNGAPGDIHFGCQCEEDFSLEDATPVPGGAMEFEDREAADAWASAFADEWRSGLSQEEQDALAAYRGSGYRQANRALRGAADLDDVTIESTRYSGTARDLQNAIARSEVPDSVISWRGAERIAVPEVGSTVTDLGFASTSVRQAVAEDFAGPNGVLFRITVPEGSHVAYIADLQEAEILLPAGSSLQVTAVTERADAATLVDAVLV